MDVRSQISMVFHLDKCIGCHTCSIACKNIWTDRKGTEYMWWNNVETKPGTGYPRRWEDQERYRGGWKVQDGELKLQSTGKAQLVANMNNVAAMNDSAEHIRQWRQHVQNILRLLQACGTVLDVAKPDVIVANVPFYYRWRVPFELARARNISVYSSMVGERRNSFAWNRNNAGFFDASACWPSFRDSGLYQRHQRLVADGIEERKRGNISHIRFLPAHAKRSPLVDRIAAAIAGRPAVLLAAMGAVVVGCIVFIHRLGSQLGWWG